MTTELEDRLRTALSQAASEVDDDLDLDALIERGRRAQRDRNQRHVLGAVAAAAAVGVFTWAGSTPRTQDGVPEPAQSASVAPGGPASATMEIGSMNRVSPAYPAIEASVRNGVVTFRGTARDGESTSTPSPVLRTIQLDGARVQVRRVDARLSVGVVADRVDWLSSDLSEDLAGWTTSHKVIPGTNLTAFALFTEKPATTDAPPLSNLVWRSLDGQLRAMDGQQVSSATLQLSDDGYTIFYAPGTRHIGYFTTLGGPGQLSSSRIKDSQVTTLGGSSTIGGTYQNVAIGMLPVGATGPVVTTNVKGTEVAIGALQPDGRIVFVARLDTRKSLPDDLVKSVVYTAADGRKVTYRG